MTRKADVVVVGAGAAGTWAATRMARAGRDVVLVERASLDDAGACWVNGVAPWMMRHAGLPEPRPPVSRGLGPAFVMASLEGPGRVTMRPAPVRHIDMRHLVRQLHRAAVSAGVEVLDQTRAGRLTLRQGRPVALSVSGPSGSKTLEASLFVDAAGMSGVLREQVPTLATGGVPRSDVCSAAQHVHHVRDPKGAASWLSEHRLRPGESVSLVSVAGGFSTLTVQVSTDLSEVDVLTGSIPVDGVPSGPRLLADFIAQQPWIGAKVFGGAGAIPLRRAWDRLGAPGIALLGDAACQVFPGHGSGVGPGLVAAFHLSESARRAGDPGSLAATWRYQADYQRDVGAVCAAYGVFRRLTQGLTGADSAAVLSAGIMTETMAAAGLLQKMPLPRIRDVLRSARGMARAPRLARQMAPAAARMQAVHALYRRYPLTPHEPALAQWAGRVAWLFGEAQEPQGTL